MATIDQFEQHLLNLINAERANVGAAPLKFDDELINAAERHSTAMDDQNFFSHTNPVDGSTPSQRVTQAGYGWTRVGENISYTSGSHASVLDNADVESMHQGLMNSSGHRANILNANFQEIGLAFDVGNHNGRPTIFLTEVFARPNATEAAETDIWG
jgi:uncharacterized protein YkwD